MSQDPMTTILNLVQAARDIDLGNELYAPEMVRAARTTERALYDDGRLTPTGGAGLPEQRLDWIVPPGEATGILVPRFLIPSLSGIQRVTAIATTNASGTFQFDILVNGIVPFGGSGSIQAGQSRSTSRMSIPIPAGSVISVRTNTTIAQGATITVFYRQEEPEQ